MPNASTGRRRQAPQKGLGDRFIPVDWKTAYSDIRQRLEEALGSSPASVVHLRGSGSLGVSKAFTDGVFTEIGARGTRGSLCAAAGDLAVALDTGAVDGLSDAVAQPRPGSDRHLALAVAKLLLLKTTRDVPWLVAATSAGFRRRPRRPPAKTPPRAQISRLAPAAGRHTIVEGDRPVRER